MTIAVVTRGGADKNKDKVAEHGLSHVLLQTDREVSNEYKAYGTPTAVIVSAGRQIDSPVAGGADAIRALYSPRRPASRQRPQPPALLRPLEPRAVAPQPPATASRSVRASGSRRPRSRLPDLTGKTVSLDDFKGKETMLVFWNPGCGFCKTWRTISRLGRRTRPRTHRKSSMSRPARPRRTPKWGFRRRWCSIGFATGRTFGASGTPSAVLVDAQGKIASDVAVGAPGVLGFGERREAEAAAPEEALRRRAPPRSRSAQSAPG